MENEDVDYKQLAFRIARMHNWYPWIETILNGLTYVASDSLVDLFDGYGYLTSFKTQATVRCPHCGKNISHAYGIYDYRGLNMPEFETVRDTIRLEASDQDERIAWKKLVKTYLNEFKICSIEELELRLAAAGV